MNEKYNLCRILREIQEDEAAGGKKSRRLTQEEIKQLVAQKKKTVNQSQT